MRAGHVQASAHLKKMSGAETILSMCVHCAQYGARTCRTRCTCSIPLTPGTHSTTPMPLSCVPPPLPHHKHAHSIALCADQIDFSARLQAAAALIFFNFLLSCAATLFAVRAVDEIKAKQREDYNRFTVLSDTLQYEPDQA